MYSYYRPGYARARNGAVTARQHQMETVLGAEVMWAVAAYADRVNGGVYVKDTRHDEQGQVIQARNRDIIREEVQSGLTNVTPEDFELGRQARAWHRGRLMFKALRGQELTDFERSLQDAVQQEEFSNRSDSLASAIVASQIASYNRGLAQEQLEASVDQSPLAAVGDKVSVEATVVRSVYSMKYDRHFITARTTCNRLVFFGFREAVAETTPIRIRGTVKAHRPDSTQLSRVKLV